MLVLLYLASGPALAQQPSLAPTELTDYERVRVAGERLSPNVLVGRVVHAEPSGEATFLVDGEEVAVDLQRAQYVRVFTGRDRATGALIGGGIGLGIGLLAGGIGYYASLGSDDLTSPLPKHERIFRSMEAAIIGSALGAVAGAGIGALIGYPRWKSVSLALEPQRGGAVSQRTVRATIVVRWTP